MTDDARLGAFEKAITRAVRADDVVLDLGCGIGTYAFYAARAGARRVHGVELESIVEVGRTLAKRNGLEVDLTHGDVRDLVLPEPVTLLVFEDFLANLLEGPARELLDLVRETLLAPDARILPQRARL
ncbi:MAG: class I SAM-dependent methyltransferase, partial [Deltaproteobacteria bacterium]|nr:class I SAM-dependent methyltransferase [Deltaproteobacteria bacterium]